MSDAEDLDLGLVATNQARPDEDEAVVRRLGASITAMLREALVVRASVPATPHLAHVAAADRAPVVVNATSDGPDGLLHPGSSLADLDRRQKWITDLGGIGTARATGAAILLVPHVIRAAGVSPATAPRATRRAAACRPGRAARRSRPDRSPGRAW